MLLLKSAGFELRFVSRKTEACYFAWPGRNEVLRVAAHKSGGDDYGLNKIVSKITFGQDAPKSRPGTLRISEGAFLDLVRRRIGEYMLASNKGNKP